MLLEPWRDLRLLQARGRLEALQEVPLLDRVCQPGIGLERPVKRLVPAAICAQVVLCTQPPGQPRGAALRVLQQAAKLPASSSPEELVQVL